MFWGFDGAGNFKEGFSAVKKDGKYGMCGKWGIYKHQR